MTLLTFIEYADLTCVPFELRQLPRSDARITIVRSHLINFKNHSTHLLICVLSNLEKQSQYVEGFPDSEVRERLTFQGTGWVSATAL